jgi:hypothetical protein
MLSLQLANFNAQGKQVASVPPAELLQRTVLYLTQRNQHIEALVPERVLGGGSQGWVCSLTNDEQALKVVMLQQYPLMPW